MGKFPLIVLDLFPNSDPYSQSCMIKISISINSSIWRVISDLCISTQRRRSQKLALKKYMVRQHPPYRDPTETYFIHLAVVYNDASRRPDPAAFSKIELWHTDVGSRRASRAVFVNRYSQVSYELQPPSTTSLKVISGPEFGGDTLFSSGCVLPNIRLDSIFTH